MLASSHSINSLSAWNAYWGIEYGDFILFREKRLNFTATTLSLGSCVGLDFNLTPPRVLLTD